MYPPPGGNYSVKLWLWIWNKLVSCRNSVLPRCLTCKARQLGLAWSSRFRYPRSQISLLICVLESEFEIHSFRHSSNPIDPVFADNRDNDGGKAHQKHSRSPSVKPLLRDFVPVTFWWFAVSYFMICLLMTTMMMTNNVVSHTYMMTTDNDGWRKKSHHKHSRRWKGPSCCEILYLQH